MEKEQEKNGELRVLGCLCSMLTAIPIKSLGSFCQLEKTTLWIHQPGGEGKKE